MTTILVTGCNRGIGLELARQLQARGDTVIGVCRNAGQELLDLNLARKQSIISNTEYKQAKTDIILKFSANGSKIRSRSGKPDPPKSDPPDSLGN